MRRSIANYLRTRGLIVLPADDIAAGLIVAAQVDVDVVVVAVPDADAVAGQMETFGRLPKVSGVIALVDTPSKATRRRRRGQAIILPRPVDPVALRTAVMRILRVRRAAPPQAGKRQGRHNNAADSKSPAT